MARQDPNLDLVDSVKLIADRLYALEMALYNPETWFNPNPVFDTITIDDGFEATILDRTVERPADETVTTSSGTFNDDVFIDVEWENAADHQTSTQVEIALKDTVNNTYELVETTRVTGNTVRFNRLLPGQTYGIRVNGVNALGIFTNDAPWHDQVAETDNSIPPAVSNVLLVRGASSVIVKFTPLTEEQAWDVAMGRGMYRVQIDTTSAFNTGNLRESTDTSFVRAFGDIGGTQQNWHGRVAPIDSSGNQGPWTVATAIVAGGVNDSMIVADISAAKITAGSFSGDRITANTLDAAAIKTSTLASTTITLGAGGQFQAGSPPTTGLLINSQGMVLYGGGVQKAIFDATTGSATFKGTVDAATITGSTISGTSISGGSVSGTTITGGTFQTDTSGARLIIDQSTKERIRFYDSSGSLVGSLGWKSSGYGTGLYLTAATRVVITDDAGNLGSGYLSVYSINFNNATCETLQAYTSVTAPNLITTATTGGHTIITSYNKGDYTFPPTSHSHAGQSLTPSDVSTTTLSVNSTQSGSFFMAGSGTVNGNLSIGGHIYHDPSTGTSNGNYVRVWNQRYYYNTASSRLIKRNIHPIAEHVDTGLLYQLQPVAFQYNPDNEYVQFAEHEDLEYIHFGFIAEDVAEVLIQFSEPNEEGQPWDIRWNTITTLLVAEIQKHDADIKRLRAEFDEYMSSHP